MVIGVPKEIKDHEFRVALTPHGVKELCGRGHRVLVQKEAGEGSGFEDQVYRQSGAILMPTAQETFGNARRPVRTVPARIIADRPPKQTRNCLAGAVGHSNSVVAQ